MFRAVVHQKILINASRFTVNNRHFVSTVLLSRTWENETLVTLRHEAKTRGLSTKGNKSDIINRIQVHEESKALPFSQPTPAVSRNASSSAAPPQTASPGIPPASQPAGASKTPDFFLVRLPNLSQDGPPEPVQVPFVPDFWDSSSPKPEPIEPSHPKLHVVSGSATHPDGGPTYNLEKPQDAVVIEEVVVIEPESQSKPAIESGLFRDLADDLGLQRSFQVGQAVSNVVRAAKEQGPDLHAKSRPLNNEQARGVWVLLGLLAGSWIVGGWVNRARSVPEVPSTEEGKH
ncbi:uncharacterized protein F5891DRAFT_626721 [Suillus fuscotomentosus]|uniref:SAP domain-containing protein n=1 Tax=Suillus fuscotomentosus TaxID=1912939 RepID=A0AAD4EIV0_9AGAM|nr:uncharacterized protein F5891DRAFT_626721 [Suillus fuscotomentosus]KAG1905794.1 hypothetical protein F5891DRAFT_626721 [Suillus fuscotomentosus]